LGFPFCFLALLVLARTFLLALGEACTTSTWHGHTSKMDSAREPAMQDGLAR
jgi:hypothetical protein